VKVFQLSSLALVAAAIGFVACSDNTSSVPDIVSDANIAADIASSSGDAMASSVKAMMDNETLASLPGIMAPMPSVSRAADVTYTRTHKCYNASDVEVTGCSPVSQVRKVVTHVTANGTRSGTSPFSPTVDWTGVAHRVADDTLLRNFNTAQPAAEVSRTHNGLATAHDTATFTGDVVVRVVSEAAVDSIRALTWNLPRSSNPWPASGRIVRVDTVHVVATAENQTAERTVVRIVEVDFPPDAQGNVVLKVNDRTCNLNLVTHLVTNCQ
jgi:hypothetical protein